MLRYPPDYIGYWGGKEHWSPGEPLDIREYRLPMTICAAKCGRWWIAMFEDTKDGFCDFCHREQFEGEPDELL